MATAAVDPLSDIFAAVAVVIQPPQLKPTIARAIAPAPAPTSAGFVHSGMFMMVSSSSVLQARRIAHRMGACSTQGGMAVDCLREGGRWIQGASLHRHPGLDPDKCSDVATTIIVPLSGSIYSMLTFQWRLVFFLLCL